MNEPQIQQLLLDGCRNLLKDDQYLFDAGLGELTRTSSLAHRIRQLIESGVPDCPAGVLAEPEYNRDGNQPRNLWEAADALPANFRDALRQGGNADAKRRLSRTDLVIHRRGPLGPNLCAAEAKLGNPDKVWTAENVWEEADLGAAKDWAKLACLRSCYNFIVAAWIVYAEKPKDRRIRVHWINLNCDIGGSVLLT